MAYVTQPDTLGTLNMNTYSLQDSFSMSSG